MSTKLSSGHEVEAQSKEWLERMEEEQVGYKQGMVRLQPEGWLLPTAFTRFADRIYNFEFRPSDVIVMTMPKSGTTWMQEILWTMLHNPDLTHPKANINPLFRAPQIDMDMLRDSKFEVFTQASGTFFQAFSAMCPGRKPEDGVFLQLAECVPDRRVFKTHLPLALFSPAMLKEARVVYVARNPRDVVVSMFHHFRLMKIHHYRGTLDDFVKAFMNDDLLYSPYWPHVKMAWEKKDHPNLHFVFYEEMKADIKAELGRLNQFLGANLSEKQLDNVAQHSSFASMKARADQEDSSAYMDQQLKHSTGGFYRKGEIGDWRNTFSAELKKEMDRWVETNSVKCGISFK